MADDDDENEDDDGSDDDSVTSESQQPSRKKKKGQRFFCTDFPPCQLSFTRSEHLARHIRCVATITLYPRPSTADQPRKHTGERPFQCHCSRRFSRLDNLRQHAQTVHVNEDIPNDSLAATGTRFQRQIRTDRVRPAANRSRTGTMGSQGGGHSRGHSRNLSTSSIGSTASSMSIPDDGRRRAPPPLAMAQDGTPRARLSTDTFNSVTGSPGPQYGIYSQQSPTGYSTPTSATFSTGASSPRFEPNTLSPPSSLLRSSHFSDNRTPARRLSVPSAVAFQAGPGQAYPPAFGSPMLSSAASAFPPQSSLFASPTSSVFSHGRRESDAELDWRRRTWHPGTYTNYVTRPATSGLTYHQTPDDSRPALASQPAASQITRLPGIESFDHGPAQAGPSQRQSSSSMQLDHSGRPSVYPGVMESVAPGPDHRRKLSAWEAGLHQNLTKLDIAHGNPPQDGQGWIEQGRAQSHNAQDEQIAAAPQFEFAHPATSRLEGEQLDARKGRRQAWYGGPVHLLPQGSQPIMIAQRPSPDDSGSSEGVPTPSTSQGKELHPAIMHANGSIEMAPPGVAFSLEQQKAMQAQSRAKPEPVRNDSGFQTYGYGHASAVPGSLPHAYLMQSGHPQHPHLQQLHHHHQPAMYPPPPPVAGPSDGMGRLAALVAVATSEDRAIEPRS